MRVQAKETEDIEISYDSVYAGTVSLLERPHMGTYFVAYDPITEVTMGMMMIHFEMSVFLGGLTYWINSVYVHPDHRMKGVFRALYDHVI